MVKTTLLVRSEKFGVREKIRKAEAKYIGHGLAAEKSKIDFHAKAQRAHPDKQARRGQEDAKEGLEARKTITDRIKNI